MQVALEPPSLLVPRLDDPRPRRLDLGELEADLDAEPGHLDRERRSGGHAVEQVALLRERRVVEEQCGPRVVSADLRARPTVLLDPPDDRTGRVRVGRRLRQPEEELGQRVVQRLREHRRDLLRRAAAVAHLVLERPHEPDAVVARAAVAAIDGVLDPRTKRAKGDGDDERRDRRHPGGATTRDHPEPDGDRRVRAHEHDGQDEVDERAVDELLDRVQPVARHRDSDREGHRGLDPEEQREHDPVEQGDADGVSQDPREEAEHERHGNERCRPGEPHRLETLDARRAAQPQADRVRTGEQAGEHHAPERPDQRLENRRAPDGVARHRVRHGRVVAVERLGVEHGERHEPDEADRRSAGDPAPSSGQQPPVRKDERDRDRPCVEQRPARAVDLELPPGAEHGLERDGRGECKRPEQQDPGDHVARLAQRDREAHDRRRHPGSHDGREEPRREPVRGAGRDDVEQHEDPGRQAEVGRDRDGESCEAQSAHADMIRLAERMCNPG